MAQPPWTGRDFVAEPFLLPVDTVVPANATYSATTNALFPKLSCDEAKLVQAPDCPGAGCSYYFNMTFLSGSCEMQVEHFTASSGMKQYVYASENYVADVHAVSCSDEAAFLVVVTQTDIELRLSNHRYVEISGWVSRLTSRPVLYFVAPPTQPKRSLYTWMQQVNRNTRLHYNRAPYKTLYSTQT